MPAFGLGEDGLVVDSEPFVDLVRLQQLGKTPRGGVPVAGTMASAGLVFAERRAGGCRQAAPLASAQRIDREPVERGLFRGRVQGRRERF